jgi:hypothetical protein
LVQKFQTSNTATSANTTQARQTTAIQQPQAKQQKLTTEQQEKYLASIEADLKREASKPKMENSQSFKFDNVGETHRIEFDPFMTKIDPDFVYGKPMRDADGKIMKGPNGEMRHADTGEILYSKFTNKDGSKRILRPTKRYIFYGWHVNNREDQALRFVANQDNAEDILNCVRQTHIFDIMKKADNKYSIKPIFSSSNESEAQSDDEEQEEPTAEELAEWKRQHEMGNGEE